MSENKTNTPVSPEGQVWQPIETAPEGQPVETCIDAGTPDQRNEQKLRKQGRLWWTTDQEMYVYYTPTHWRPL